MTLATLMRAFALALAALMVLVLPAVAADPAFPELNGRRVVDEAHLLSDDDQAALTQNLADLEARTTDQLVVVTVPSLQGLSIEEYGFKLGNHWGVGLKGKNNGVLLIVAPAEHLVRIEVGLGLEDVLADSLCSRILEEAVLPRFRAHDYPGGVAAGARAIDQQLSTDRAQALAAVAQTARPWKPGRTPRNDWREPSAAAR